MKITELFKEENAHLKRAYCVELPDAHDATDVDYSEPPENLEFVGFLLSLTEDSDINDDLLDTIVTYKLTNLPVCLDIPSNLVWIDEEQEGKIGLRQLILLSSNLNCALSFLPPNHPKVDSAYTVDEYKNLLQKATLELLNKPHYAQQIMPISNYQDYLMLEQILGKEDPVVKNFKPEDEYVLTHYVPYLTVEEQDRFKNEIKKTIFDFYGGEEKFADIAKLIFREVAENSKNMLKNHISLTVEQNKKEFLEQQAKEQELSNGQNNSEQNNEEK